MSPKGLSTGGVMVRTKKSAALRPVRRKRYVHGVGMQKYLIDIDHAGT